MKQTVVFCLLLGYLLAGCKHDKREPGDQPPSTMSREVVLENISIELDTQTLSAIGFEVGEVNKVGGGKGIAPKIKSFRDYITTDAKGRKWVKVNTALSNGSSWVTKELKWEYTQTPRPKLRLDHGTMFTSNEVEFTQGASNWYICGIIGGTLDATKGEVRFTPTTELKGVSDSSPTGGTFNLKVPIGFNWTPVIIQLHPKTGKPYASIHYPYVGGVRQEGRRVVFKPLGSVIGYQLGNALPGTTITPTSFTVFSSAFTHYGTFNLKTPTSSYIPTWTADTSSGTMMHYTFDATTPPGTLSAGQTSAYRYYAWVMPNPYQSSVSDTRVLLEGTGTGLKNSDRTNIWMANSKPGGFGWPIQHKAYTLKASLTQVLTIRMPLEQVTEYNLAGGIEDINAKFLYPQPSSPAGPWPGMTGKLRFANRDATNPETATNPNPHGNNQSGYYNWYITMGQTKHQTSTAYNPNSHTLLTTPLIDVDGTELSQVEDKYFVPELEDWWGVVPKTAIGFYSSSGSFNDFLRLGAPNNIRRFYGRSYASSPVSSGGGNVEVYVLRFQGRHGSTSYHSESWYLASPTYYPEITDNSMVMGYKYTRVGAHSGDNLDNRLIVESVYLGEKGFYNLPTKDGEGLKAVWNDYAAHAVKREFPAAGAYAPNTSHPFSAARNVNGRGRGGYFWSATQLDAVGGWVVHWYSNSAFTNYSYYVYLGMPVRLFLP